MTTTTDEPAQEARPQRDGREAGLVLATDRDRDRMRLAVLVVLGALAAYLLLRLLAPFTLAIVTAGVVAVLAHGAYERLRRRMGSASLAAFVMTIGVFTLVVVPLAALLVVLLSDLESTLTVVMDRVEEFSERRGRAWALVESTADLLGITEEDLVGTLEEQASGLGAALAGGTFGLLSGLGGWFVQGGIGLFTLFYLLRDGNAFLSVVRWLVPLEDSLTNALVAKTREVITATVLGALLVALVQGALGGLLFWVLGLPAAALWGGVMAFAGLLPAIGPPVVWIPAAVILFATDQIAKAVVLVLVGTFVVGTVDNVLRAILVGGRAQLHPLIVFFSVLGGLVVFGAAGFLFGPILFVLALAALEIARVALAVDGKSATVASGSTILSQVTTSTVRPGRAARRGTALAPVGPANPSRSDPLEGGSTVARSNHDLEGKAVAIIATSGFETVELRRPLEALRESGASPRIISTSETPDSIRGWSEGDWDDEMAVDATFETVSAEDFDALVIPGGVINPDRLRMNEAAVSFVRDFVDAGKPVAAICHGPWMLVEADVVRGRRVTSYPSLRTDLENAGAEWVDEEVVVDEGLVTSRSPKDLDAFVEKMLEEIQEGVHHQEQQA